MIDSVPLIQNANDAQQINASIIAMKKASRELDEKIVKLNSLNSELDKKIALLDSGLNKEIEDRKEAIKSLDVPSVGGSGKYISAISETDGKISATASDLATTVSSGNSQPVTSGGVENYSAPKVRNKNTQAVFVTPSNWGIKVVEQQFPSTSIETWQPMVNVEYSQDGKNSSLGFFQNYLTLCKNNSDRYFVVLSEILNDGPVIIRRKTMTQTTNTFGTFLLTTEKPIFARCTNIIDAMCIVGSNPARNWVKVCNYDFTPLANVSVELELYYL